MPVAIFPTDLGWMCLTGGDGKVDRVLIGHESPDEVRARLAALGESPDAAADWHPELRRRIEEYASGARVEFLDVAIRDSTRTRFERTVLRALRQVGYGETVTYGELARRCGSPRAARAVGAVMARNRVPILLPCHRVIAAGGGLGGFSAPQGVRLKQQLLDLEQGRPVIAGRPAA